MACYLTSAIRSPTFRFRKLKNSTHCRRHRCRAAPHLCRSWKAAANTAASVWCHIPAAKRSPVLSTTCSPMSPNSPTPSSSPSGKATPPSPSRWTPRSTRRNSSTAATPAPSRSGNSTRTRKPPPPISPNPSSNAPGFLKTEYRKLKTSP